MVISDGKGGIRVFPYGSEPQQRWENFFDILYEACKRHLEKKTEKKLQKEQLIDSQIEECDKKVFHKCTKRSAKRYNMTQTARILGVHRETLYYWIKKGRIKPKRDYKNYPVFTVLDIEELIKWKNTIKC
ncbi:MAG: MerR family transcriptional regulator [Candidatus Saelkia tenebricola]|nr:MerR family transcriptional regulator [Candidatus Saelkia tenebricola]